MSTHVNFAAIIPNHDGSYRVAIVRGVEASGNSGAVKFSWIADGVTLLQAADVAKAAPRISQLDFYEYAKAQS